MAAHTTRRRRRLDALRCSLASYEHACADLAARIDGARQTVRAASWIGRHTAPHILALRVAIATHTHRLAQHRQMMDATRDLIAHLERALSGPRTHPAPEHTDG